MSALAGIVEPGARAQRARLAAFCPRVILACRSFGRRGREAQHHRVHVGLARDRAARSGNRAGSACRETPAARGKPVALAIDAAALADDGAVEEIAGIELHARRGRQQFHDAAGPGILQPQPAAACRPCRRRRNCGRSRGRCAAARRCRRESARRSPSGVRKSKGVPATRRARRSGSALRRPACRRSTCSVSRAAIASRAARSPARLK